jgi:hypothetical protein
MLKTGLCVLAAAAFVVRARTRSRRPSDMAMLAFALLSMASYYGFFRFEAGYIHRWEAFHYALSAKYFTELGFDGLYAASLAAQMESDPDAPLPGGIRDLRTGLVVPPSEIMGHAEAVRARFDEARWAELVADNHYFLTTCGTGFFERIRRDHGFNATPAWTAIARALLRVIPIDDGGLFLLAMLDPLLLVLLFAVLHRTFGFEPAAAAALVFGLGYLHRFYFIGGAILRLDWLCATGCALAALERRRWALAGALLGIATGLRVFPALFLFGPLVYGLAELGRGGERRLLPRLLLGFAAGAFVMGLIGTFSGRGFAAWPEFAAHIARHASGYLTNNVGLGQSVLHVFHLATQPVDAWGAHMDSGDWIRRLGELHRDAALLPLLAALPLLAITALASLRASATEAGIYGLAVVFALTAPTSYYWCMLLFVPLAGGRWATVALLLVDAGLNLLGALSAGTSHGSTVYGVASWALLVFFVAWLGPKAAEALREGASREAAAWPAPPPSSS